MPQAAVGQVTLAGATFQPDNNWNGATQFTYRAQETPLAHGLRQLR